MKRSPSEYVPQLTSNRRPVLVWTITTLLALFLVGTIVGAPISEWRGHSEIAATIYSTFGHFCHQLPERSFFIAGRKFAVCARCTGIYAGVALALLLYPLFRPLRAVDTPDRKWLFVAAIPLAIDFSLTFLGIWQNTHSSRVLTGALLGGVAVLYILPGLVDLSLREWRSEASIPYAEREAKQ